MATGYGLIAIIMWGSLAILGVNTQEIPAFQLLFLCFSISAIIMFARRLWLRAPFFTPPTLSFSQWLIGIVGLFGFHFCYFMALKLAPAIEVSLIVYTWPLLLALYVANSNTRLYALIGGSLGFIGISFIILSDNPLAMNKQGFYGYLLSLVAALIWASYSWFLSRSKGSVDDIGWLSVAVSLSALVAHLSLEPSSWQLSVNQWSGVLLLGLGPVGGAFYLWDLGLKNGNKTLLASLSFSAPLISSVLLALAGYNKWSTDILIALGFVLIGAIIANKKPSVSRKTASLK